MTRYNTSNIKLSNSQLDKLKSAIKNGAKVTLNLSSNIVRDSNNENNYLIQLLTNNYWLIHKFQSFVKLLQIILLLI